MPFFEIRFLAALRVKLHQRVHIGSTGWTTERLTREIRDDFSGAYGFIGSSRRAANENPAPARCVIGLLCIERSFDANRSDMREVCEARRRSGLDGVARKVLVKIEHRSKVRLEERDAQHVPAGFRGQTNLHAGASEICAALSALHRRDLLATAVSCR
jgi:hypothetical protein